MITRITGPATLAPAAIEACGFYPDGSTTLTFNSGGCVVVTARTDTGPDAFDMGNYKQVFDRCDVDGIYVCVFGDMPDYYVGLPDREPLVKAFVHVADGYATDLVSGERSRLVAPDVPGNVEEFTSRYTSSPSIDADSVDRHILDDLSKAARVEYILANLLDPRAWPAIIAYLRHVHVRDGVLVELAHEGASETGKGISEALACVAVAAPNCYTSDMMATAGTAAMLAGMAPPIVRAMLDQSDASLAQLMRGVAEIGMPPDEFAGIFLGTESEVRANLVNA